MTHAYLRLFYTVLGKANATEKQEAKETPLVKVWTTQIYSIDLCKSQIRDARNCDKRIVAPNTTVPKKRTQKH